jgi:hypothetical protein
LPQGSFTSGEFSKGQNQAIGRSTKPAAIRRVLALVARADLGQFSRNSPEGDFHVREFSKRRNTHDGWRSGLFIRRLRVRQKARRFAENLAQRDAPKDGSPISTITPLRS